MEYLDLCDVEKELWDLCIDIEAHDQLSYSRAFIDGYEIRVGENMTLVNKIKEIFDWNIDDYQSALETRMDVLA